MNPIKVLKYVLLTMKYTRSSRRRMFHGELNKGCHWERQCSSWIMKKKKKKEGNLHNPKDETVIPADGPLRKRQKEQQCV